MVDVDLTATPTRISSIIAYSDQALVVRSGAGKVSEGANVFVLEGLPVSAPEDTIRVELTKGEGKLTTVEVFTDHEETYDEEKARELEDKLRRLQKDRDVVQKHLSLLSEEKEFLTEIEIGKRPKARKPPERVVSVETWAKAVDFLSGDFEEACRGELKLVAELRELDREISVVSSEYDKVGSYHSTAAKRVLVGVESPAAGDVEFAVSYIVPEVRWQPYYELRVDIEEAKVNLACYAILYQETGEDWEEVKLSFSSAMPSLSADVPELMAWYIREKPPEPQMVMRALMAKPSKKMKAEAPPPAPLPSEVMAMVASVAPSGEVADYEDEYDEDEQEPEEEKRPSEKAKTMDVLMGAPSEPPRPEPKEGFDESELAGKYGFGLLPTPHESAGGYDYRFDATGPQTVKSSPSFHKIALRTVSFPGNFRYEASPLSSPHAFLTASVKNDSGSPLLAGVGEVYLGSDFVGRHEFETLAENAQIKLDLGVDENIKIDRKETETTEEKGLLTSTKIRSVTVRIELESFKDSGMALRLLDRIPFTWDENIEVVLGKTSHPPVEGTQEEKGALKKGVLQWNLRLEPKKKEAVEFSYTVKAPRDFIVTREAGGETF